MSSSTATHTYTPKTRVGKVTDYVDSRVGGSQIVKEFGRKIFPDHWTFMFGEVALYTFVILLISGTFLTFFYDPSMAETHYEGSYLPLRGVEMSVAYASSLDISFDVRGGLFMRQIHHWACSSPPSPCTCCASSSPARSVVPANSTGSSAASCSS
jgi:ubiquinol-cytochrome c reductase cytochrome b subunit